MYSIGSSMSRISAWPKLGSVRRWLTMAAPRDESTNDRVMTTMCGLRAAIASIAFSESVSAKTRMSRSNPGCACSVDTSTSAAIITTGESSGGLLDAAKLVPDSVEVSQLTTTRAVSYTL